MTALLGDAEAALDVVQDGFALALRRRASFRREGDLEGWLWRIVLNVARDRGRSRRREARAQHRLELVGDTSDRDDDLRALVLALPERQRLRTRALVFSSRRGNARFPVIYTENARGAKPPSPRSSAPPATGDVPSRSAPCT